MMSLAMILKYECVIFDYLNGDAFPCLIDFMFILFLEEIFGYVEFERNKVQLERQRYEKRGFDSKFKLCSNLEKL